jgi:hypothetical protein
MKLNIPFFKTKQSGIWLIVFVLGVSGFIFLIDQAPAPMNQAFDTYGMLNPDINYAYQQQIYGIPTYTAKQEFYQEAGVPQSDATVTYNSTTIQGQAVSTQSDVYEEFVLGYAFTEDVFLLDVDHPIEFTYEGQSSGLLSFSLDYFLLDDNTEDTKISLTINDELPFYESQALILPAIWQFATEEFALDRYENELQPLSVKQRIWQTQTIRDMRTLHAYPFEYYVEPGDVIGLHFVNADVLIGRITSLNVVPLIDYDTYVESLPNAQVVDTLSMISSRSMTTRSDASIRLRTEQDVSALYYDTQFLRLNTIFGDSWERGGQSIKYEINITTPGLYALSFRYRQYLQNNGLEIMKFNSEQACYDLGLPCHQQIDNTPSSNVPHKYKSTFDTSPPGFGYCNSDLKNQYLSREQLNARLVSPSISVPVVNGLSKFKSNLKIN